MTEWKKWWIWFSLEFPCHCYLNILFLFSFRLIIIICTVNCHNCIITWTLPHPQLPRWTLLLSPFSQDLNKKRRTMITIYRTSDSSVKGLDGLMVIDHYHRLTDPGGHFLHGRKTSGVRTPVFELLLGCYLCPETITYGEWMLLIMMLYL